MVSFLLLGRRPLSGLESFGSVAVSSAAPRVESLWIVQDHERGVGQEVCTFIGIDTCLYWI